jgi:hypothetical protein
MITPRDEHKYMNGQCHALALALHALTDCPIIGVDYDGCGGLFGEEFDDMGEPIPHHVAVLTPDQLQLDIMGVREPEDGCRHEDSGRLERCFDDMYAQPVMDERTWDLAEYLAKAHGLMRNPKARHEYVSEMADRCPGCGWWRDDCCGDGGEACR